MGKHVAKITRATLDREIEAQENISTEPFTVFEGVEDYGWGDHISYGYFSTSEKAQKAFDNDLDENYGTDESDPEYKFRAAKVDRFRIIQYTVR